MLKDPMKFTEVKLDTKLVPPDGVVHVMASRPVAVFGELMGVECLLGTGTDVQVRLRGCDIIWVESQGDYDARAFLYNPSAMLIHSQGEVFTSVDRQPLLSGHAAELQAQMRRFKLEQQQILDQGRREIQETKRRIREEAEKVVVKPKVEDEPKPAEPPKPEEEDE